MYSHIVLAPRRRLECLGRRGAPIPALLFQKLKIRVVLGGEMAWQEFDCPRARGPHLLIHECDTVLLCCSLTRITFASHFALNSISYSKRPFQAHLQVEATRLSDSNQHTLNNLLFKMESSCSVVTVSRLVTYSFRLYYVDVVC